MLGTEELQNIVNQIGSIDERDQLQAVFDAVKGRADELTARTASSFARGDVVRFEHKGTTCVGKVVKINRKTIGVRVVRPDVYVGVWKVSPSLVTECAFAQGDVPEVDAPKVDLKKFSDSISVVVVDPK